MLCVSLYISIKNIFLKDFLIYFQGVGKGRRKRGRETLMCERDISWLPLTRPQLGTWPATEVWAPTRNQTGDLPHRGTMPSLLSHTSQGSIFCSLFGVNENPALTHEVVRDCFLLWSHSKLCCFLFDFKFNSLGELLT